MVFSRAAAGQALLWIFFLSGAAGLIYQSVWSHYLGLTLGHAAYAQTLVLAIFMGGMALGAWWAGRRMHRWRHLVLAYAIVEGVIGLVGLLFHPTFLAYTGLSQGLVLPALETEWLARLYQWSTAALLIAPQSILLGATFPLLSAGYLRIAPGQDARVLGGLYFSNSIGAALGALLATFLLLPAVGMPGAVLSAGVLNILVAVLAWWVWKSSPDLETPAPAVVPKAVGNGEPSAGVRSLSRILLVAAFITGASSFFYEVTWVRLLNMALGTTVHSFELMLAAFIAGLAFGGLWVRRRGAAIRDAIAYAGYAQMLMAASAFLSIFVFANSFEWVGWMMLALDRSEAGYTLFSIGSASVALLVMFPAAFFAGMTLPLFTMALLRSGEGEGAIGRIYAANTLGAIVGVALVVHVAIPLMGLRLSLWIAALADLLLGMYLLRSVSPARWTPAGALTAIALAVFALGALQFGRMDPEVLAGGVFRTGQPHVGQGIEVPYIRDGKTATVAFAVGGGAGTISTNGKPDAGLVLDIADAPRPDEITMVMAGALPLLLHPSPERVAIVGWGSGLTTHSLLGSDVPQVVETIEIERAMYDGARLFGERVARAYGDPRSVVKFEDARTYFATGNRSYDVIVSEPSNPWVSGVASLFTREFYAFVARHLDEDGMLVQWIQSYELSDPLLATMMAALLSEFPHVDVYLTNQWDLLLVARTGASPLEAPHWERVSADPLAGELRHVALSTPADLAVRRIGDQRVLETLIAMHGAPAHSDFYPTVSLQAPKARFTRQMAGSMHSLVDSGMPVLDSLAVRDPVAESARPSADPYGRFSQAHRRALAVRNALRDGAVPAAMYSTFPEAAGPLSRLFAETRADSLDLVRWSGAVAQVAALSIGHLPAEDLEGAWIGAAWAERVAAESTHASALLDAYEAAALRDGAGMSSFGEQALILSPQAFDSTAREQMLVIAMLGSAVSGRADEMDDVDDRLGGNVQVTAGQGFARAFLRAWAGRPN